MLFYISLAVLLVAVCGAVRCPDGVTVRKEFRDMSYEERRRFRNALGKLYNYGVDGDESIIDRMMRIYLDHGQAAQKYTSTH